MELGSQQLGLQLQGPALPLPATLPVTGERGSTLHRPATQSAGQPGKALQPAQGQCRVSNLQAELAPALGAGHVATQGRVGTRQGQCQLAGSGLGERVKS